MGFHGFGDGNLAFGDPLDPVPIPFVDFSGTDASHLPSHVVQILLGPEGVLLELLLQVLVLFLGEPLQCAHIHPVLDLVRLDKEVKVVVGLVIAAIEDVQVQVIVLLQDFPQVLVHTGALRLACALFGLHGKHLVLVYARIAHL